MSTPTTWRWDESARDSRAMCDSFVQVDYIPLAWHPVRLKLKVSENLGDILQPFAHSENWGATAVKFQPCECPEEAARVFSELVERAKRHLGLPNIADLLEMS